MKTTCIIPARGGSKGLPNKNTLPLNGIPLISHTIRHAQESKLIDNIIVSTDCDKIKAVAIKEGAYVPFVRPASLSGDTATTESTLQHAIKWLDNNDTVYDIVLYLDCCQPFRKSVWIDQCIENLHNDPSLESSFTARKLYKNIWTRSHEKLYWEQYSSRQSRSYVLEECTGLACASRSSILRSGKRIGDTVSIIEVDAPVIDIHTKSDLAVANTYNTYYNNNNERYKSI